MKKITKLLILSLSAFTCFTACGNPSSSEEVPPSSSEEIVSSEQSSEQSSEEISSEDTTAEVEAVLTDAVDYLWQMYKDIDSKQVTGTFDVVNKVTIGGKVVDIAWEMEVTGAKDGYSLTKKDENFSTLYIGYFDSKITEPSSVKLVPTLTYNGVSKTLKDVFADKEYRHSIDFTTPQLVLNSYAEWLAAESGTSLTIMGTVVDVISEASGSSSKGSFYMMDKEGNGYYVWKPSSTGAKQGSVVVVEGEKKVNGGQMEFNSGSSYQVIDKADASQLPVVNATADWSAANTNTVSGPLANKYQNIPVKLEGCTPVRVEGKYYWFTIGEGTTEYNIYDNNYFLSDEQISAWKAIFNDAMNKGYTFTLEGISTVYSQQYQVYPSSLAPHVLTKEAELSVDQKHEIVKAALEGAIKESYTAAETIEFKVPAYATVELAVTAPTENATVAVSEGKLVVTPSAVATENTVTATVTIGESTQTVTLTINTGVGSYEGYKGVIVVTELGLSETRSSVTKTIKATSFDGKEVDVTVKANNLIAKYSPLSVVMEKAIDNDSFVISAPDGYVISTIEVDGFGTYDNINFHNGQDATGAALTETFVKGNNLGHYTIAANCQHVTIDNPQTNFNGSFYDVSVTLKEIGAPVVPSNTKTIEELAAYKAADNTVVQVSGVVQNIYNTTYGNLYLTDPANGKQILVYGLGNEAALTKTDGKGTYSNNKSFASLGVSEGDYITVEAIVVMYNNASQLNAVLLEKGNYTNDVTVTIPETAEGTVVANKTTANYGDTITLTVTPAEGYKVKSVKVNHTCPGSEIKATAITLTGSENTYTFTAKVYNSVEVVYEQVTTDVEKDSVETALNLSFSSATNKADGDAYLATNYPKWEVSTGKVGATYGGYLGFGRSSGSITASNPSSITSGDFAATKDFQLTAVIKGNGSNGVVTSTLTFELLDEAGNVVATGYANDSETAAITPVDQKDTTYTISFTYVSGKTFADASNLRISFAKATGNIGLKSLAVVA